MSNFNYLSVLEASRLIKSGKMTPEQLIIDCLDRIKSIDQDVLAWRLVDEAGAIETARQLTEEIKNGIIRSPLHGIPIGVKDTFDVVGMPTRAGSKVWENRTSATKDSKIVASLRRLGAVILGKTHTTTFAFYDPAPTRNPYNLNHTPGGSSSGSAVAVSTNTALLSIGAQTNASMCRPAAYNGVVGFTATTNTIGMEGSVPLSPTLDSPGVFGQNVLDIAIGFEGMGGGSDFELDEFLAESLINSSFHVGVVTDPIYLKASKETMLLREKAIQKFKSHNFTIGEVKSPMPFSKIIELQQTIMAYEAAQNHSKFVEDNNIGGEFGHFVEVGRKIKGIDYKKALNDINQFNSKMERIFGNYDILMAPPADRSAPEGIDSTGEPWFTTPWAVFGGPLLVLPAGLDTKGLPLAMMFASKPGTDIQLIKQGLVIERIMGLIPKPTLSY